MKLILIIALFVFVSSNGYHKSMLQPVNFNKLGNDKMLSWEWSDFHIGENETIYFIKIELFSFSNTIGKFKGAIGTTTTQAPDYWYITEDMLDTFNSNEGAITWHVPKEIGEIIPKNKGQLKLGIWDIGLKSFYIKSLYVETMHHKN